MVRKPLLPQPLKTSQLIGLLRRCAPSFSLVLLGFIIGVLCFGALRFILVHPREIHYHSNFALYINGQREEFAGPGYYEEIAACSTAYDNNVKGRAHMHDNVNDVIHVHDKRVTYQDFFENIGWSVGADYIHTDTTLYANSDAATVKYILNGKQVDRIDDLIIGDKDRLLVSYGPSDTNINAQFKTVTSTAAGVDKTHDPASCGGLNGPDAESFSARLKRAIGFSE